ncbi:MAG: hypothetical protein ASUL_03519 [Candidatus Aramenus sulfurataquae]|jgi:uncharacterized membrane protein|uniref:DUF2029 domain-containing protein n=2 Tax=Candidatus Aramenus sulfurataquae TaxID=1326980 RepID=W7L782_9CREN|nr:MAG: hypothetical protein ASUL_03519 [Candidatus Aramenus sulfurataquae]MCL7343745.1 hypothetical protein [Candidatus Aramenus sulfurataquae]
MSFQRRSAVYAIVGLTLLASLFIIEFRDNVLNFPIQASVVAVSFFSAVAIFVISLNPRLIDPNRDMEKIDDVVVIISVLTYSVIAISLINGYGTDDMEYISQAVAYFLHMKDPYEQLYHPSGVQPTYLINGAIASNFVYPPLSFLLYIPLYLLLSILHVSSYFINGLNVVFQDILVLVTYWVARKRNNPMATLSVVFALITTGILAPSFYGVNGAVWATFLALSYVSKGKKSGVFLGLASSFSQLAWLVLPFILIYKRSNIVEILKGFLLTVAVIDLPFLLWNPAKFLDVVTLDQNTIPVGVTGFTIFNFTTLFSVEPWFFTVAMAIAFAFLIYAYYRFFDVLKETLWVFPMIILWFSWRTLTDYFLFWPELMLLSIFSMDYNRKPITVRLNVNRNELIAVFLGIVFTLAVAGGYAHAEYVAENPIRISEVIVPTGSLPISKVYIVINNTANTSVNVTLVRVSIPSNLNMVWNFSPSQVPPHSSTKILAYTNYTTMEINSTSFTVQVYSGYFISSYKVNINATNVLINGTTASIKQAS